MVVPFGAFAWTAATVHSVDEPAASTVASVAASALAVTASAVAQEIRRALMSLPLSMTTFTCPRCSFRSLPIYPMPDDPIHASVLQPERPADAAGQMSAEDRIVVERLRQMAERGVEHAAVAVVAPPGLWVVAALPHPRARRRAVEIGVLGVEAEQDM